MYAVTADFKNEEMLVDALETLASVRTIASDFAHLLPASDAVGHCATDHARGVGGESGFG